MICVFNNQNYVLIVLSPVLYFSQLAVNKVCHFIFADFRSMKKEESTDITNTLFLFQILVWKVFTKTVQTILCIVLGEGQDEILTRETSISSNMFVSFAVKGLSLIEIVYDMRLYIPGNGRLNVLTVKRLSTRRQLQTVISKDISKTLCQI